MKIQIMKNRDLNMRVNISAIAYQKMMCYTNSVKTEIGWLGTASRNTSGSFLIEDVWLLEQEVHGATAELTTEGISKLLYDELSTKRNYDYILNNMKVWGHSHNSMPTMPSQQDDKQMEVFEDGGYDFFLRLITNHAGDIGITLYDYETGIIYSDLDWDVEYSDEQNRNIKSILKQLEYYETLLDNVSNKSMINEIQIQKEIKSKVKEKKYTWNNRGQNVKSRAKNTQDPYEYDVYGGYYKWDEMLEDGLVDIDEDGGILWID